MKDCACALCDSAKGVAVSVGAAAGLNLDVETELIGPLLPARADAGGDGRG